MNRLQTTPSVGAGARPIRRAVLLALVALLVLAGCGSGQPALLLNPNSSEPTSATGASPAGNVAPTSAEIEDKRGERFIVQIDQGLTLNTQISVAEFTVQLTNPTGQPEDIMYQDPVSTLDVWAVIPPDELTAFRAEAASTHQSGEITCPLPAVDNHVTNPPGSCGVEVGLAPPDDNSSESQGVGAHQTVKGFESQIDGAGQPGDTRFATLASTLHTVIFAFQPGTSAEVTLPGPAGPLTVPASDVSAIPGGTSTCHASPLVHKDHASFLPGDQLVSVSMTVDHTTQTLSVTYVFNGSIATDPAADDPQNADRYWTDVVVQQDGHELYDLSDDLVRGAPSQSPTGMQAFGLVPAPTNHGNLTNRFEGDEAIMTTSLPEVAGLRPGFTWSVNANIDVTVNTGQLDPDGVQTCGPETF